MAKQLGQRALGRVLYDVKRFGIGRDGHADGVADAIGEQLALRPVERRPCTGQWEAADLRTILRRRVAVEIAV
jgi:hypothetical protein